MLKTSFRPAHKGPTTAKKMPCGNCQALPGSKPWPLCTGCFDWPFCSKECQQASWEAHKPMCQRQQRAKAAVREHDLSHLDRSRGSPTLEELYILRANFIDVHRPSIEKAVHSVIICQGGLSRVDISKFFVSISLVYRPDSHGNPSIAFRIDDGRIRQFTEMGQIHKDTLAAGMDMCRIVTERARQMYPSSFVDLFLVFVHFGDHFCFHSVPLYRHLLERHAANNMGRHEKWLQDLQKTTERGYVLRQVGGTDNSPWKLGVMRKDRSKWEWAEL